MAPGYPSEDAAGIRLVTELVQARPTSESQAQAWSDAFHFAEENADDVGYPYIDPTSGVVQLSAASERGIQILEQERSSIATPTQIRNVKLSFGALEGIKHEITTLHAEGVPDADLIYMTAPDHESNRIVVTVTKPSQRLFKELASRYGTDAIAIEINGEGPGGGTATRNADFSPYFGGARIFGVQRQVYCSDSFAWSLTSGVGNAMLTAAHCTPAGGDVTIDQTIGDVNATTEENWSVSLGTRYYTGQSTYRGDVALIRINGPLVSAPYIYRGGTTSGTASKVLEFFTRYSTYGDHFLVGGQAHGETGPYTVDAIGIDWWYSNDGPNVWVRNVSRATFIGSGQCIEQGDSGGSIFKVISGGVKAAGTLSGFAFNKCNILFTDIYRSYWGLPGEPFLF